MVENDLSNLTSLRKTQLHIMHATYLVMECYDNLSPQKGYQVFTALHSKQSVQVLSIFSLFMYYSDACKSCPYSV